MAFFQMANIKKTIYYLKRNGIRNTFYAVLERLEEKGAPYQYIMPDEETKRKQCLESFEFAPKFSILVPAYETKECYLRALVDSVLAQTYKNFELIIADAGKSNVVEQVITTYADNRIVYKRLAQNGGISENTNQAMQVATGDYIGLLDHDDFLTPDALYEMAKAIELGKKEGMEPAMLYSDEDKCDGDALRYFEPHKKYDFNMDLLLSNNYVCHFLVMKAALMKKLSFRKEYDGAQDYDITLRAVEMLYAEYGYAALGGQCIVHIPKILYHWRCHEDSTAANPESKRYAYEAGKRAVSDFLNRLGWSAKVTDSAHLGFYHVKEQRVFEQMGKVAAVGGKLLDKKRRIAGGPMVDGKRLFVGLKQQYSGYMHRAVLRQTVQCLDLRCIRVNPKFHSDFEKITGLKYEENPKDNMFFREKYELTEDEWQQKSSAFCKFVCHSAYRLVFLPDMQYRLRK